MNRQAMTALHGETCGRAVVPMAARWGGLAGDPFPYDAYQPGSSGIWTLPVLCSFNQHLHPTRSSERRWCPSPESSLQ